MVRIDGETPLVRIGNHGFDRYSDDKLGFESHVATWGLFVLMGIEIISWMKANLFSESLERVDCCCVLHSFDRRLRWILGSYTRTALVVWDDFCLCHQDWNHQCALMPMAFYLKKHNRKKKRTNGRTATENCEYG